MNLSTAGLRLTADSAIDLHMHTTYSDGRWMPEQLIDHLLFEHFDLAAITDHDHVDTISAIQQLALEKHLPVLTGVEMSSTWKGEMVDLLCYGFDSEQSALNDLAQDLARRQSENSREVFDNLMRQGYAFPGEPDALAAILAIQAPFLQLNELAALLNRHGYGQGQPSVGKILREAGGAYMFNDPVAVVDAAHRSGAVCLLAHPGHEDGFVTYDVQLLDEFRQIAPIDGLEVYHPCHTPAQTEMYREYAQRHHLLVSAGGDSHKPEKPPVKYRAELCRELLERVGIQVK
jgi:predicted metal-dependent phosphoesterase TrpH